MKKIITLIAFTLISFLGFSQKEKPGIIERNIKGIITSVEFRDPEREQSPNTSKDFFDQYLEISASDHFEKVPHQSNQKNLVHEHYDQYYKGVKVDDAGYNLHFKDGKLYFANGNFVKVESLNASPFMTNEEALISFLNSKKLKEKSA
jgi:Zn-dependent metalloprotease